MTTVTQQQLMREARPDEGGKREKPPMLPAPGGSPVAGILKGGRLWNRQSSGDQPIMARSDQQQASDSTTSDDDSTSNRRSVRFVEEGKRDVCDGAPADDAPAVDKPQQHPEGEDRKHAERNLKDVSPDSTEMTLTFKLGNHHSVLISNNSLKPNSAVRQLFPSACSKASKETEPETTNAQQYLVTSESLRAFEEAKRARLPPTTTDAASDDQIRRAIERNALRRSLIRYEARSRRAAAKKAQDNSLVERIKQLTCGVDDEDDNTAAQKVGEGGAEQDIGEDIPDSRTSPPGEEARNSPETHPVVNRHLHHHQDKMSFSPSSSSTGSSSSMSSSSTMNRGKTEGGAVLPDIQSTAACRRDKMNSLPDIGGPHHQHPAPASTTSFGPHYPDVSAQCLSSTRPTAAQPPTMDTRRQFLQATLAPLTACVGVTAAPADEYYYHLSAQAQHQQQQQQIGDRTSVASSAGEYSLEDIDEALREETTKPLASLQPKTTATAAPDVVAGTGLAAASEPPPGAGAAAHDELAAFVQQDATRIERLRKKYQPSSDNQNTSKGADDSDDEHDDYGFNRRPSVRGIKPRFGTTTEILQQIQNQLQPPPPPSSQQTRCQQTAWPYYSESGLSATDNAKRGMNQNVPNYQYTNLPEEYKNRGYVSQYRPASLPDENLYQNCTNQRCIREIYRTNVNTYQSVVRVGCNDYYQSLPRQHNGRPQSPPPTDMSKQYHQTMLYIPYNHIEGYQPVPYYHSDYARVTSQNQINKRYVDSAYAQRLVHVTEEHHYATSGGTLPPKSRPPYPPGGQPPPPGAPHSLSSSRSESPLPLATARGTQTQQPPVGACSYYPGGSAGRYRPTPMTWQQGDGGYATVKANRHSFPAAMSRYPPGDNISMTDTDSQHGVGPLMNGYRQSADLSGYVQKDSMPNSPTKPRFIERGVPEGAASVSPQDSAANLTSSSTMTSPTSPQNSAPPQTNQKPLFYAMNV